MEHVAHGFGPVFNAESRVLVLGTMPSPKSREHGFYYAHPQNRFWPVLAALFGEETPVGTEERRNFALRHKIALWDVLEECDIVGAADASIRNPVPVNLSVVLDKAPIAAVFTTGKAAHRFYEKFLANTTDLPAFCLPSPSPANARFSPAALQNAYREILEYLD